MEPSKIHDSTHIDYDLHGIVGIRLVNADEKAASAVVDQLGPARSALQREPDIEIHFRQEIATPGLIFLGLDSAGYNADGFYILRSGKAPCKAQIPFHDIGRRKLKINCESNMRSVPLLIALINLTFLSKGFLPLHASAFNYDGSTSLVTGWAKGGKTEALLAFARHGASYVADEWTIIAKGGGQIFGITEPMRLWEWQLREVPHLTKKISRQKKMIFSGVHTMNALGRTFNKGALKKSLPAKVLNEALPAFNRQLNVRMPPQEIFQDRFCDSSELERIFLIMSHDDSSISVEACDPMEIAERMISSNEYELIPFMEHYRAFTFAFPQLRNSFLDGVGELQYSLLKEAFTGRKAYRVLHPYPVSFEDLFQAMEPHCSAPVEKNLRTDTQ